MNTQLEMPIATRATDPVSSLRAEQKVSQGKRQSQMWQCISAVRKFAKNRNGITAGEVAKITGIDRTTVSKRLSDARAKDLVKTSHRNTKDSVQRLCTANRTMMVLWWPA